MGSYHILEETTVAAGAPWSGLIRKGERLRIIDIEGQQAVDFLCYDPVNTSERYDSTVTSRIAGRVYVKKGDVLYSNIARPFFTIVEDTVGWHDTIAGCCSSEINEIRYGVAGTHSCRSNFLELALRHGLDQRDIVANINFFMYVPPNEDGDFTIQPSTSRAGDLIELFAERDTLVLLSNCPQKLNAANGFNPSPISVVRISAE